VHEIHKLTYNVKLNISIAVLTVSVLIDFLPTVSPAGTKCRRCHWM